MTLEQTPDFGSRWHARALLGMVLVIATAGLVYELGMAAVASYVLGDSVRQFSIVIGIYLSALGLGAYLSRFVENNLAVAFINVELSTALLGGLSAPGLFIAFSLGASFELLLLVVVTTVGTLVGIELPLLMRILEHRLPFKDLISRALSYDYAGALLGSLGFSLYFVPQLGLVETSIICGLLNAVVGIVSTFLLRDNSDETTNRIRKVRYLAIFVIVFLVTATVIAPRVVSYCETRSYGAQTETLESPYQHIALVNRGETLELYLNGHLQFSSRDECRYHEALVHPIMSVVPNAQHVFIGGGGDGLALREVLKWPQIQSVTLVDLDPVITHLAKTKEFFLRLNHNSLSDPRVRILNEDAFQWVEKDHKVYDVVILDFPDPTNYGIGKLFSTVFYSKIRKMISPQGALIVQSTSPLVSNLSFWSIRQTLISVGFTTLPLRIYLPSFGDWGFVLARVSPIKMEFPIPEAVHLECLKQTQFESLTNFPVDTSLRFSSINSLNSQSLVHQYLDEASRFD